MRIENPDLLCAAIAKADEYKKELDRRDYQEACRKADPNAAKLVPTNLEGASDTNFLMIRDSDEPERINHDVEFERRRLLRKVASKAQGAEQELAEFEATRAKP